MPKYPQLLIAVPEDYRSHIIEFCNQKQYHYVIADNSNELTPIINSNNLSGVIVDNRWLQRSQENSINPFVIARERRMSTITFIAFGGNSEITRWFEPPFHQYITLPFSFDELQAFMRRARMVLSDVVKGTVLILWDDDRSVTTLFSYFFRQNEYNTIVFSKKEELLTVAQNTIHPIIITKTGLLSSEDVSQLTGGTQEEINEGQSSVIVGYAEGDEREAAYQAGASSCFGRVFDIEDILRAVISIETNRK
jgi:DNA-binding NtrC family response regulator